jgi:hypothetical protein
MVAAPEYDLPTQAKIPPALAVLHNFIWIHDPDYDVQDGDDYEDGNNPHPSVAIELEHIGRHISQAEKDQASER